MSVDKPLEKIYTDKSEVVVPNYYEVLVYDTVTDKLVSSNIVGEKGGSLSIFPGTYHLVIYSFGTESTQQKDLHNRNTANAFTTDITASKGQIIKSKVNKSDANSPEFFWASKGSCPKKVPPMKRLSPLFSI